MLHQGQIKIYQITHGMTKHAKKKHQKSSENGEKNSINRHLKPKICANWNHLVDATLRPILLACLRGTF